MALSEGVSRWGVPLCSHLCRFYENSCSPPPSQCGTTYESLRPTGFSVKKGNPSTLLGGPVRWACSLGRALTNVHPQGAPQFTNCKNEYLVLALGEETAVQAVVDSTDWAFRRLK